MNLRAALTIVLAVALISVVIFAEHLETVSTAGVVEPDGGYAFVTSDQSGRIAKVFVGEGQTISSTTQMAELSPQRIGSQGQDVSISDLSLLKDQRSLIKERLSNVDVHLARRMHWIDERIRVGQAEEGAARIGLQAMEPAIAEMRGMITRYRNLEREGYVSNEMLSQRVVGLQEVESRRLAAAQQLSVLERQSVELRAERASLAENALGEKLALAIELKKLDQQIELADYRRNYVVVAGTAGHVVVSNARESQYVVAGERLFTIAPENRKAIVRLEVPAELTARLAVGHRVSIRLAAFPYQKYGVQGGAIYQISGGPNVDDLLTRERPAAKGTYRVLVELDKQTVRHDDKALSIPFGTPVDADIELSNEPIFQWAIHIFFRK